MLYKIKEASLLVALVLGGYAVLIAIALIAMLGLDDPYLVLSGSLDALIVVLVLTVVALIISIGLHFYLREQPAGIQYVTDNRFMSGGARPYVVDGDTKITAYYDNIEKVWKTEVVYQEGNPKTGAPMVSMTSEPTA